ALDVVSGPKVGNVRIDRGHLEQVIVNLAVNARDAMPEGGQLRIQLLEADLDASYVAAHPAAHPGHYVVFAVSDTGSGMTKEVRERLFEPFFTTKPAGKGTGLGLATSFGIVSEASGHIGVYSELGVGTTMKVYLPRAHADALAASDGVAVADAAGPLRGTVLVVEDDDAVRRTAVRVLEKLGCTVLQADGAASALQLIGDGGKRPDLLFTDVVMPGMQGPDLAARVLALLPEIKVLFATGYTSDMAFRHGLLPERANLLSKPYTPADLSKKVRESLSA
ncbi:MAG: ATP-binding protein, partial [Gemmatimonadota bacterium]